MGQKRKSWRHRLFLKRNSRKWKKNWQLGTCSWNKNMRLSRIYRCGILKEFPSFSTNSKKSLLIKRNSQRSCGRPTYNSGMKKRSMVISGKRWLPGYRTFSLTKRRIFGDRSKSWRMTSRARERKERPIFYFKWFSSRGRFSSSRKN